MPHMDSVFLCVLCRAFPSGNGSLLGARQRELAFGRVLGQRGAGGDGRAFTAGGRRYWRRVSADENVVLDYRMELVGAVVVADDGAGADVDVAADGGVAEIGMVIGLGVIGDLRVLHFDEVADMHVLAE